MKTAISIPDEVFEAAERAAKRLGVSRSQLYSNAVKEFIERHRRENVTDKLNEVYFENESASELDAALKALQAKSLPREEW